jgi:hypothetical protein
MMMSNDDIRSILPTNVNDGTNRVSQTTVIENQVYIQYISSINIYDLCINRYTQPIYLPYLHY